jgi:HEAT repeat protein
MSPSIPLGVAAAVLSVVLPWRPPTSPEPQAQAAPAPLIQNGRVETRAVTSLERDLPPLAGPDPVWAFWRVPMVAGERSLCSTWFYGDHEPMIRGDLLDSGVSGTIVGNQRPQITPPAGPVPLEAGTGLMVFVRLFDGRVERLRTLSDDCPVDANGRTVYSLTGVTPAESLRYLDTFLKMSGDRLSVSARRNLADSALAAIRRHRDPGADVILDRIATSDSDTELRRSAATALATSRGAHGFATVKKLVDTEQVPDLRRSFVSALGQTREPGTVEALRALLRDPDSRVRAQAVYYLPQRGGAAVVPEVRKLIETDTDTNVKQQAVRGLARLPANDSVPLLIQMARTSADPVVRKESVSSLSQSRDARAVAYIEEIIKR